VEFVVDKAAMGHGTSGFPCQYHSTSAPYTYISFITFLGIGSIVTQHTSISTSTKSLGDYAGTKNVKNGL
jgi:hypothetical protein